MKASGHGYVGCEVYVVGFRPRPDDNDHRCGAGSVLASSALLAARSTSLEGQSVQRTGASRHAEWRCGRRRWLAPVADLPRSLSQANKESLLMKATGPGNTSRVDCGVGLRAQPDHGCRRCRMGSVASMGLKYHEEPRRARRGRTVTHLSPLGTLRRAVTCHASMADVHSPRTQRLGVHFIFSSHHGCHRTSS